MLYITLTNNSISLSIYSKEKKNSGPVRVKSRIPGTVRSKPETRLVIKTKPETGPLICISGPVRSGSGPGFFPVQSGPTGHMLIPI